jgi:hypothetical protein
VSIYLGLRLCWYVDASGAALATRPCGPLVPAHGGWPSRRGHTWPTPAPTVGPACATHRRSPPAPGATLTPRPQQPQPGCARAGAPLHRESRSPWPTVEDRRRPSLPVRRRAGARNSWRDPAPSPMQLGHACAGADPPPPSAPQIRRPPDPHHLQAPHGEPREETGEQNVVAERWESERRSTSEARTGRGRAAHQQDSSQQATGKRTEKHRRGEAGRLTSRTAGEMKRRDARRLYPRCVSFPTWCRTATKEERPPGAK